MRWRERFVKVLDDLGLLTSKNPYLWTGSKSYPRSTVSSEWVSEDTALNYSAVWCATKLLCGTGASLPLPLFRGLEDRRERIRNHPVDYCLNKRPNPEMTAYSFRSIMWQWQVNWGAASAEIERVGNEPDGELKSLWPLHPERVQPARYESGELYFKVRDEGTSQEREVEAWRMLYIPSILTSDGIVGRGVISNARETIGAAIAEEKYAANYFGKGGMPTVVVEMEGRGWNEEQRTAFRKDWESIYGGGDASRVALLQGGATAKPLNIPAKDLQFIETRQFSIEEIARWYGVPPHMLQHLLRATFDNIEELGIEFVQYSLIPWLEMWEQTGWMKLLTAQEQEDGLFIEHKVDALLRGNHQARAQYYQSMISSALMTRNEARKLENLDPVPGGDTFLVQGATVPLDSQGRPESEFAKSAAAATPEPTQGDANSTTNRAKVSMRRVLKNELNRVLTKESKAMQANSRKPSEFVDRVDEFYAAHSTFVNDAVCDTLTALADCGEVIQPETVIASWIHEGKNAMLEAAGNATPAGLSEAVNRVVESTYWRERPERVVGVFNGH